MPTHNAQDTSRRQRKMITKSVLIYVGGRTQDSKEMFSTRHFANLHEIYAEDESPMDSFQSRVTRIPPGFRSRHIIFNSHSAHTSRIQRQTRFGTLPEILARNPTGARVYVTDNQEERLSERYMTSEEVAADIGRIATLMHRRTGGKFGSATHPFSIYAASCYAGNADEQGDLHQIIGNAMSSAGMHFEVYASIPKFSAKGETGRQLRESLRKRGTPLPSSHWARWPTSVAETIDLSSSLPPTFSRRPTIQSPLSIEPDDSFDDADE